jgi:hypothetical protein
VSAVAQRAARLASPGTALVLGVAALLLVAGAVPLAIVSQDASQGIIVIPFGIVGYIVARRQPRNPIGWILLATTVGFLLSADGGTYAVLYYHRHYRGLPLPRIGAFLAAWWIWLLLLLPLAVGLFPDGRLSGVWRRVVWGYLAVIAVVIAGSTWQDATGIVARHIRVDRQTGELLSAGGGISPAIKVVIALSFVGFCVASIAVQILAYRRSAGAHRQQLKWLLTGGAVSIAGLLFALTLSNNRNPVLHVIGSVGFGSIMALPISIGIGILRYRLYEIDRLISRTLSYALLTGMLVGVFAGIALLPGTLLSSSYGVAASTLAIAALFNPLRNRLQRLVDRRFNRARYDAEGTVAAFGARLRDAADPETVLSELAAAAGGSLQPAHVSVWVKS